MIPTGGVYPIATANDKSRISDPLLTRFAVIDIPDYTPEEKKVIFKRYSLPRILARIGMKEGELTVTDDAIDIVIRHTAGSTGVRDLEQAAEHLAANALYRIETQGLEMVRIDAKMAEEILEY
jgi:ATP-dependent Lon protease